MSLDPVLDGMFVEGHKLVHHTVYPMHYSIQNINQLWNKTKQYKVLFSDEVRDNFHAFCETFFTLDAHGNISPLGLTWVVDDFLGVYYMKDISRLEATVDFSFFDKRLAVRVDLTKHMIDYVFKTYGFNRLNVEVADYANPSVFNFVTNLGFKREGKKRSCIKFNGNWHHLWLFGLLRDEVYVELKHIEKEEDAKL